MSNNLPSNQAQIKQFFNSETIKKKFEELLGSKAQGFLTSALQIINGSSALQKADNQSLYNCVAMAATLDLPIQQNLGFAWIVPYKGQAQFQIGWKGFVQLAQRSGQYKFINVIEVYKNQLISYNALTEELQGNFDVDGSGEIVGYCAYFKLLNGFEKTTYWSKDKVNKHALKYSQAYKSTTGQSPWKDPEQFHEMAKKTVLKNTISKWGPMSIEMQKAVIADQGVIEDIEHEVVKYPDNEIQEVNHSEERILALIGANYESKEEMQKAFSTIPMEYQDQFQLEIQLALQNWEG